MFIKYTEGPPKITNQRALMKFTVANTNLQNKWEIRKLNFFALNRQDRFSEIDLSIKVDSNGDRYRV